MEFTDFTKAQLDAVREMGNIGAGNAATAMGQFLNTTINMEIPAVSVRALHEVTDIVGKPNEKVVTLQFSVLGDVKGFIIFVIKADQGKKMVKMLLPDTDVEAPYSEMEQSCLMEMGNILSSAFVIALSSLTKKFMSISIPRFNVDMVGAIFSQLMTEVAAEYDELLVFDTSLTKEDSKLEMNLFLFLPPEHINVLLKAIGMS